MEEVQAELPAFDIELGGRKFYTEPGIRQRLRKTPRTWRRMREHKRTPPEIRIGRLILYDIVAVQSWLDQLARRRK